MKVSGSHRFDGARERIWPLIHDPNSLVSLIPGCEQMEQVGPDEYRGRVQLRLPAVVGTYTTYVRLIELDEPCFCRFEGEVNGSGGSMKGTASFRLETVNVQTILEYEGEALITGPLARLDFRFMEGIVQTLIKQGLTKLNEQVQYQAVGNKDSARSL